MRSVMSNEPQELALESSGCSVSYSSCGYEGVGGVGLPSCRNIIDGSRSTFWATTGLYPHTFIVSFPRVVELSSITLRSCCVKRMVIERCAADLNSGFEVLKSLDLELTDLQHQVSRIDTNSVLSKHLRFTIAEGYQEICAIYKHVIPCLTEANKSHENLQVEVLGRQFHIHS